MGPQGAHLEAKIPSGQQCSVELPGIEPAPEIALNSGNAGIPYAKRRESTENDLRIRERCLCDSGSCLTFRFRLLLYGSGTRFR